MFSVKSISEALGTDIDQEQDMIESIELWKNMYQDKPPWLNKNKENETLNLPSTIASEMARLVTLEMNSEITAEDKSIELIDDIYQKAVLRNLKVNVEYACALGSGVFKPFLDKNNVAVEYYLADEFVPIRFNSNGDLEAVAFIDTIRKDDKVYTKIEYHDLEEIEYMDNSNIEVVKRDYAVVIRNYCFVKHQGITSGLGEPTPLTDVVEWADLEAEAILENVNKPVFSYFKMPLANQVKMGSKIGVSIFSRAVNQIKKADSLWTMDSKEYSRSEKKVWASEDMIKRDKSGNYIELPELISVLDAEDPSFYKEYNPEIRFRAYHEGLNETKRRIEFNCNLAYGTLSKSEDVAKTATEIKASKQRSYATVVDIQKSLEESLKRLIESIIVWYEILENVAVTEEYEVSFDFDDSLVVDSQTEQETRLLEVGAGIRSIESYLKDTYNLTDDQIKETIPQENLEPNDYDDLE